MAPNGPDRAPAGARSPRFYRGLLTLGALLCFAVGPAWLGGCAAETRYRVLTTIFDGVPPPGTPRVDRRRRRVVREEPPAPSEEDVTAAELELAVQGLPDLPPDYETFEELSAALPRDSMGNVDWVAAAEKGLIRPEPGIDPEALESPILPYDVHLDPGVPGFEVVFPHAAHTYWLRCDNCHPAIFQMKAGANPITMEKIFEGEYCGKCHGKVAFPPQTGCQRCHVNLGKG